MVCEGKKKNSNKSAFHISTRSLSNLEIEGGESAAEGWRTENKQSVQTGLISFNLFW